MKRRAVELSERRMTPEEITAFQGAKGTEVKNFVASKAFEILPDHLKPDRSQAIGMRWILTWKLKEDGTRKPKARAVLLGYQDEAYEHRSTTSPVMTRQTRQNAGRYRKETSREHSCRAGSIPTSFTVSLVQRFDKHWASQKEASHA